LRLAAEQPPPPLSGRLLPGVPPVHSSNKLFASHLRAADFDFPDSLNPNTLAIKY
jgi:hypothetical protein